MYDARPGNGSGRLLVSLGTLAIVCAVIAFQFHGGGTLNPATLVYLIPAAAIGLALVFALLSRILGLGRPTVGHYAARQSSARLRTSIAAGALALVAGGVMLIRAEGDLHRYRSDAACQAGFALARAQYGACRLAAGTIESAYSTHSSRGGTSYYLSLGLNDGTSRTVTLAHEVSGNVWNGARSGVATLATVQYFGADVVQVETSAGYAETTSLPRNRLNLWALVALGGGLLGALCALRLAFMVPN